jgi:hypothetical protein
MIVHLLRHASLCLWISLPIAGFGSFWILTVFQPGIGAAAAPFLAAGLLLAAFAAVAWTANRLGVGRVQRLMRRADHAEREGLRAEAEKAFHGALGVLDSFSVSPRARQKILLPLAGRIARYYLSASHFSAAAEDFIARYLWIHPQDEEVAEQWVGYFERLGGLREEHQDLADRIGNAHPRHPAIQHAVARLCLASERTDYPALQTYRRACAGGGRVPPEFCADLARLLRQEERFDEWAQAVFRQAEAAVSAPTEAPSAKPPEPSRRPLRDEGPAKIEVPAADEEEDVAFRIAGDADEADADEEPEQGSLLARTRRVQARADRLRAQAAAGWEALGGRLRHLGALGAVWLRAIRHDPRMRRALTLLLLFGVAAGGGWMALNVAGVFERSTTEPSAVETASASAPPASDPFALQVAAYLKQDYALKLVEDLKKKGLNAYWIETASSGKTWYQVRIAAFPDPQSAREFGRDLKWKGVIDDFYVTSAGR